MYQESDETNMDGFVLYFYILTLFLRAFPAPRRITLARHLWVNPRIRQAVSGRTELEEVYVGHVNRRGVSYRLSNDLPSLGAARMRCTHK